jgi:DNA topoisomerase-1
MRDRHVRIAGGKVSFRFKGKSGQHHELELDDRKLARVVKQCRDLPGYRLFQYLDETGESHNVDSTKVNEYLRDVSGQDITAKHFRTWHGTVQAAIEFCQRPAASSAKELKRNLAAGVKAVAERLGNRPAACRKYYIHPAILTCYTEGTLERQMTKTCAAPRRGLSAAEQRVLMLLQRTNRSRRNGDAASAGNSRPKASRARRTAARGHHRLKSGARVSQRRQLST